MIEQHEEYSAQEESYGGGYPGPSAEMGFSGINGGKEERPYGGGYHNTRSKTEDDGIGAFGDITLEEIYHSRASSGGKEDDGEADDEKHWVSGN